MRKFRNIILTLIPLLLFLLLWEFVFATTARAKFLFASPSLIYAALVENIRNGTLPKDILVTGEETLLGFIIGNVVGVLIGLSLWFSNRVAKLAKPYIIAIGVIPIFAIAPMMIIWFGTGLYAKIMMAAISTVTIAITQAYEGARNVDDQQIQLLKSFGASNSQVFKKLVVPSSLVWLFNSLKLNVSFALLGAFIAEYISSFEGLGHRIFKAGGTYDVPLVLAALLCIILLALFFHLIITLVEKNFFNWKK
jgi:NitT/TauT family transport system permease protein